jgi:hypothetical protein
MKMLSAPMNENILRCGLLQGWGEIEEFPARLTRGKVGKTSTQKENKT